MIYIYIRMDEHFISVSASTKRWTVFVVRLNSATRQLFTTALFYNGPLALSGRRYYCNLSWWRIDRRSPLPLSLSLRHSIRLVLPIFTLTPSLSLPLKPSLFLQGARSLFLLLLPMCNSSCHIPATPRHHTLVHTPAPGCIGSCICTFKTFYAIYIRLTPQRQRRSRWRWPARRRGVENREKGRKKTQKGEREGERERERVRLRWSIDTRIEREWERKRKKKAIRLPPIAPSDERLDHALIILPPRLWQLRVSRSYFRFVGSLPFK